ncbi:MAG: ParB/RepB/Spo0J family partition protein [Patescibacteria group bacterium]
MSGYYKDSIFYIDIDKVKPNPFQPRREFDESKLKDLAESIRQYGVLQPLVATRREVHKEDGGLVAEYELIAGERRLRASKLAGLSQVPLIVRTDDDSGMMKLELAIIENLQREDLNPVERAMAFRRLVDEFGFKHVEIAKKIGKSREYVSNTLRLLLLPQDILDAVSSGKITEGHTRPILMLVDRPEEQNTLFKEIIYRKLTVRDAETIARRIAQDKVRKKSLIMNPELIELETKLSQILGTRVQIEKREVGGKITIDFFSESDLANLIDLVNSPKTNSNYTVNKTETNEPVSDLLQNEKVGGDTVPPEQKTNSDQGDDLYSVKNFSI